MLARLGVLLSIAFRNLFTRWLNLIIGLLIFAGTVLVVAGGALLDSLDRSMSSSIINSVGGDLQVFSGRSKEDVALFGSVAGQDPELSPILDFAPVEKLLLSIPNVDRVVPMGIHGAFLPSGNTIDLVLARLREAVNAQREGDRSPQRRAQVESLEEHVRHIVQIIERDLDNLHALLSEKGTEDRDATAIRRASSDAFWKEFDADPLAGLEFLENRIAPQLSDGDLVYIRYIGTDLDRFQRSFSRMKIVEGQAVPAGHRGFLFAKEGYDTNFKLKVAWRLDKIKEARDTNGRRIATDEELQRMVRENRTQTREIALQLDPQRTRVAIDRLRKALPSTKTELEPLLQELLDTSDANFDAHYAFFYDQLAKDLLELYRVRVGDVLTLNAYGRGGYTQAINLKVYGVFQFAGLEKSPLGGMTHLMDLVSFRELYGYMSPERAEELKQLKAASGAKDVSREQAEAALFGAGSTLTESAQANAIDESSLMEKSERDSQHRRREADRAITQRDLDQGVVLNAAVLLKDPRQLSGTMDEIRRAAGAAGLELKVLTWQEAAGLIGQFVRLARMALYIFVFIIFVVTLVVINNAMMMATLQRIREIGTLRAIGAQRAFVLMLVCVETLMLGGVFGGLGLITGSGLMIYLHSHGIAAMSPQLYFFFSGPRLYPVLGAGNLIAAFVIVLLVSLISTLYPALIATRVSPLQAMQTDE